MNSIFRTLKMLDYMRMVLGICIMIDGYPLIFFFRDAMRLAPGNTTFTALALAGGLILCVPFTVLRRLYRPNFTLFWLGLGFIVVCIFYMYVYMGDLSFQPKDYQKDLIYYTYILIFLFILINVPNDIAQVFIPVVVLFTLVSNMGLVYSLITDPSWTLGQRATITLNNNDEGSGNPHVFSRNAYMSIIACAIWLFRPNTNFFFKLIALFSGVFSVAILILTQTRSATLAFIFAVIIFFYFNVRPAQIRSTVRSLFRPGPILIMLIGVLAIVFLLKKYYGVYSIVEGYLSNFIERNMENVYAILGLKAKGTNYKAVLDDSAAGRTFSTTFFSNVLVGHLHRLVFGFGYKYLYLDIPLLESLTNFGIVGFALFGGLNGLIVYHVFGIMRANPNPLSVFLAYFYLLLLVQLFVNGRPNEIWFWFPLGLMMRFIGVEHLFPAYLSDPKTPPVEETYAVVPNAQSV
ncbi:hypothetical protein ACFSUS_02260 [Spirosoma soli]|uniref:Oligosaccharide repeat unit polymerase n=1 Tax=Spirosoma soli TaxID=1770529 RepID=A0ABW5LXD4_9BACT